MNAGAFLAVGCGALLAYLNGSNDVSKGIATLAGSGVTDYRRAIAWGALWTGVGGLGSSVFSKAMIGTFGVGLLARQSRPTLIEAFAVLLGAAACVGLATRLGLPVSTTHAIVGSLIGVYGLTQGVSGINWHELGEKIVFPLLLSPVLALGLVVVGLRVWDVITRRSGEAPTCVCLDLDPNLSPADLAITGNALACAPTSKLIVSVGRQEACVTERPAAVRLTADQLHWLTSGATSLARGLNDSPKIVALVLVTAGLSAGSSSIKPMAFISVALGMVAGSWIAGKRVTTVLAERVTRMDHREGFLANLVTATLVGPGAALGLPMSTTHVSSGAIIGLGTQDNARTHWETVKRMVLAWIVTVPAALLLGVAVYTCLTLHYGK